MGKSCIIRSFAGLVLALALVAGLASAALALGFGEGWWPGPTGWATIPSAISIAIVGVLIALFLFMLGRRPTPEAKKPFRSTAGIVSKDTDATVDADVIITAATLGFTATCIVQSHRPIQFDIDPKDVMDESKVVKVNEFIRAVSKMNAAIFAYLTENGIAPAEVEAGVSPDYEEGGVILGVYTLAGKTAPQRPGKVAEGELSPGGRRLYDRIKNEQVPQYTGRGAYTGFVDNPNGAPIGPLSTARFRTPAPSTRVPDPHPRWLPPVDRYSDL